MRPVPEDFKIGDLVAYVGREQNHCYAVPNVGVVVNVTSKRVMVRWRKRGEYEPTSCRSHSIRAYNLQKLSEGTKT